MEQGIDSDLQWAVDNISCKVRTEWLECGYSWETFYWKVIDDGWWWINCLLELQTNKRKSE